MSTLRIREFAAADVAAAGALLAARHRAHRSAEPLLDPAYESDDAATAQVVALLEAGATGSLAERDGEAVGFLLGSAKPAAVWGTNVWVEAAGHAVAEAETARDLYAHAATGWVAAGADAHYVLVPAHDAPLIDAWFRLGFGQQHVHAVRELPADPATAPAGVVVRTARRSDIPALARLDLELPRHQTLSPVFAGGPAQTYEEAVADWEESFDEPEFANLVAEVDATVVGLAIGCPLEKSSGHAPMTRPRRAGFLGFAAVLPEARGLGAGRALAEAVHDWARETGFDCLATDWRATNLLASRAWPRLGYRATYLRLHRRIGY